MNKLIWIARRLAFVQKAKGIGENLMQNILDKLSDQEFTTVININKEIKAVSYE